NNLGQIIKTYLIAKGFEVTLATNGVMAYNYFISESFDICILDIMMPDKDGFTLAKEIRQQNTIIPILFITARSQSEDIIKGFEIGGDDYIIKPFLLEELLARIKAILRRTIGTEKLSNSSNIINIGEYAFDYNSQTLSYQGDTLKLTSKESDLLKLLCDKKNQILFRGEALTKIWKDDSYFNARSMDVYITKLRKYLQKDPSVKLLNVHGKGFKLIFP
ncbi:MAG TPA: response regulator transcription factor, partial [Bacteroidales bacterium]|nr:response regulator transcription factor [Bacteroidales bacterium]